MANKELARYEDKSERVLQERVRLNPLEEGLQDPIWSEWQDVPEVSEELEEVV